MSEKHRYLLSVIKAALVDDCSCAQGECDIEELFEISKKHQIVPLVFHGLYKLKGSDDRLEKFKNHTFRRVFFDQNQIYCLEQVKKAFEESGIDHMLLKGSSIKSIYPSSELRLMGDIDILIRQEQYEKIKPLLESAGLAKFKETDHEIVWKNASGVIIELHKRLIPSYNDDYYSYYKDPWEKAHKTETSRFKMSCEDEYIYIFTHLAKHYRDGGIGLRHVTDIWYYAKKHPELDMAYIETELEKLELENFHKHILDTIDVWFNGKEASEITDHITERIIESGVYGIKEKWDAASAARAAARADSASSAKKKKLFYLIFMPYADMKKKYPFLSKLPFLLPVMWVVRWIDALVNKKENISRQTERLSMIDESVIDGYNRELEMVGLKFDLEKD